MRSVRLPARALLPLLALLPLGALVPGLPGCVSGDLEEGAPRDRPEYVEKLREALPAGDDACGDDAREDEAWQDEAWDEDAWEEDDWEEGPEPEAPGPACCLWLDLDFTTNTFGAFGWPFNPVPAAEFCEWLGDRGAQAGARGAGRAVDAGVSAAPLTARDGCLPGLQPGEAECRDVLGPTVSVRCSSGEDAARAKEAWMRDQDDRCARHVLIDDNRHAETIEGGVPEIVHVLPKAFGWAETLDEIATALDGC